jgi:hypothetical protein
MKTNKIVIFIAIAVCGMTACQKLVSDETLYKNFSEHKSQFNESIQLFKAQNIQSVNAIDQSDDSQSLKQLRSLLRKINVRSIRQYPEEIKLIYQGEGSVLNSTEKGYSFRTTKPRSKDTVKSIDAIIRPYKAFGDYYAPLDKNWYLFLFNDA